MSVDQTLHSLFGASKLSADILVQEYGRYFGLKTVCFRGGCLTGPGHSGTELHGFLAYLNTDANRIGDHAWWIGDVRRFKSHYPQWSPHYGIEAIMGEMHSALTERLALADDRR
jgi:nucleoside-diphosphate-sugar epimerase